MYQGRPSVKNYRIACHDNDAVIFTIIFILKECDAAFNADVNWAGNICFNITRKVVPSLHPIWVGIGVLAGWHSPGSILMTCPADSTAGTSGKVQILISQLSGAIP